MATYESPMARLLQGLKAYLKANKGTLGLKSIEIGPPGTLTASYPSALIVPAVSPRTEDGERTITVGIAVYLTSGNAETATLDLCDLAYKIEQLLAESRQPIVDGVELSWESNTEPQYVADIEDPEKAQQGAPALYVAVVVVTAKSLE